MNQELALKRKEIKLEEKKLLLQTIRPLSDVVTNPAVVFVALWIGIDWLTNHGRTYVDSKTGEVKPVIDTTTNRPHRYLTPSSGERLVVPLAGGFVAHSFGGGAGIAQIIKAFIPGK